MINRTTLLADTSRIAPVDVFLGYILSCVAAVLSLAVAMLPVLLLDPPELDSRAVLGIGFMLGLVFVTVCAIAAPGFLGFRSILWVLGRRDWPSFAVAGMATALFGILWTWNDLSIERLVQNPPGLLVPLIGGVAGAVQFHAERYLARVRLLRAPSK